jgi:steroid delta-isomerase-like uncharacterized protein
MSARENEAYDRHDFDGAVGNYAENAVRFMVPTGESYEGKEGYKQYLRGWTDAFPDSATEISAVHAGEDFVVVEFVGRGTHEGTLRSAAGDIPATGRRVEIPSCEVQQVRDGKLPSTCSYFDLAGMLAQLGLVPTPDAAGA